MSSCKSCKFYEEETGFCRKNPPTPVLQYSKDRGRPIITGMFVKIEKPEKDWCGMHEAGNKT